MSEPAHRFCQLWFAKLAVCQDTMEVYAPKVTKMLVEGIYPTADIAEDMVSTTPVKTARCKAELLCV